MVEMAARGVGVVGDENVAGLDSLLSEVPEVGLHLFGHRDHAVSDDLSQDRVRLDAPFRTFHPVLRPTSMTRLPNPSTCRRSPGRTTVVDACSSMSAGPAMWLPALSPSRA